MSRMEKANIEGWREKEFLSAREIATILNVGYENGMTVLRSMRYVKIGGIYRLPMSEFLKFLKGVRRCG